MRKRPTIERFRDKVNIQYGGKCWEWLGSLSTNGYGLIWHNNHIVSAHRFAYEYFSGAPIPPDKEREVKRTALKRTSRIISISDKQGIEIQRRQALKAKLIEESGEHCQTCKDKYRDWRGISLSHIIPLSRGGKTDKTNCILECYPDHDLYEKHPENRPLWQQIQAGVRSE